MRSLVRTASRASARTTTPASAAWAAVLTMALLCAGVVVPATSAARVLASGGSSLPLPGYADMAVHDKAGRLYITAGRSSNALLSVDFRGRVRKVLDRQSGATGLVLSADHGTLYVSARAQPVGADGLLGERRHAHRRRLRLDHRLQPHRPGRVAMR